VAQTEIDSSSAASSAAPSPLFSTPTGELVNTPTAGLAEQFRDMMEQNTPISTVVQQLRSLPRQDAMRVAVSNLTSDQLEALNQVINTQSRTTPEPTNLGKDMSQEPSADSEDSWDEFLKRQNERLEKSTLPTSEQMEAELERLAQETNELNEQEKQRQEQAEKQAQQPRVPTPTTPEQAETQQPRVPTPTTPEDLHRTLTAEELQGLLNDLEQESQPAVSLVASPAEVAAQGESLEGASREEIDSMVSYSKFIEEFEENKTKPARERVRAFVEGVTRLEQAGVISKDFEQEIIKEVTAQIGDVRSMHKFVNAMKVSAMAPEPVQMRQSAITNFVTSMPKNSLDEAVQHINENMGTLVDVGALTQGDKEAIEEAINKQYYEQKDTPATRQLVENIYSKLDMIASDYDQYPQQRLDTRLAKSGRLTLTGQGGCGCNSCEGK